MSDEQKILLTEKFSLRFSKAEAMKIRDDARLCYLPPAVFLRQQILGSPPVAPPRPLADRPIDQALFEQLRGVAGNLNQLTRHVNEGQTFGIGPHLLSALQELQGPVHELMVAFKVGAQ